MTSILFFEQSFLEKVLISEQWIIDLLKVKELHHTFNTAYSANYMQRVA